MASPKLSRLDINGINRTAYLKQWSIKDVPAPDITTGTVILQGNVLDAIDFDENNINQTIEIWRGVSIATEYKIFKGLVYNIKKDGSYVKLEVRGELFKAVRAEINKSFDINIDTEAGVISEIFKTLMNDYAGLTADNTSVTNSGAIMVVKKFICNHASVFERAEKLMKMLDWQFFYRPSDDKVYFQPKGTTINVNILEVGTNIIKKPIWTYDKSKLCNKLTIAGYEELVETTEEFDGTGAEDTFTLDNKPVYVRVEVGGVLQVGGNDSTSGTFDYSVDTENNQIIFESGSIPGAGVNNVDVFYGYLLARPVIVRDDISIGIHGEHRKTIYARDLKDVTDVQEFAREYVKKYKDPFMTTDLRIFDVESIIPGDKIRVIDSVEGMDDFLIVESIDMSYPYRGDMIKVRDDVLNDPLWGVQVLDRLRRLEEEQGQAEDLVRQLFEHSREINYERRSFALQKKIYDIPETDVFILGNARYGVLGTNKLGDTTGETFSYIKIIPGNNTYKEFVYDTDYRNAGSTTATWDIINKRFDFIAGQIIQSALIELGQTWSFVTMTLGELTSGTVTLEFSADGGATYQILTNGARIAITTSTISGCLYRITESGGAAARISTTFNANNSYKLPAVKIYLEP